MSDSQDTKNRWGTAAGTLGLGYGVSGAADLGVTGLDKLLNTNPELSGRLRRIAQHNGAGFMHTGGGPMAIRPIDMPRFEKVLGYKVPFKSMLANVGNTSPGFIAHELGHITGMQPGRLMGKLQRISYTGGRASALGLPALMAFNRNEKLDQAASVGTPLLMAPALAEELRASGRGFKYLRRLGSGRLRAATAFFGVPTYMLAAALPALMHKWKKHRGYYNK